MATLAYVSDSGHFESPFRILRKVAYQETDNVEFAIAHACSQQLHIHVADISRHYSSHLHEACPYYATFVIMVLIL